MTGHKEENFRNPVERTDPDLIINLVITAGECYATLASTQNGRKILIPRELVCKIESEWEKKNLVSLKMRKEVSVRKDNVYVCEGIELEIQNPKSELLPINC